jgi:hypothetical protein
MNTFNKFKDEDSSTYPPLNKKVIVLSETHAGTLIYAVDMMTQLFTTHPRFSSINHHKILGWWNFPELPTEYAGRDVFN